MGQQVSIETFPAKSGADGHKYWTSFDPYPFKAGSKKLAYLGYFNGSGPLKGEKCVVKTIRNGSMIRRDLLLETRKAQVAKETAKTYNSFVENGSHRITFNFPIISEIDQLSDCLCLADVLGKPKKKMKEMDYVSIELYIKGKFEDFEYGWVPSEDLEVPEAFSHFSWCRSGGNLLISNLQGVKARTVYHFTGPVIHSEERYYGGSDMGLDGIKGFFRLHKCNQICRGWPRLGDGTNPQIWADSLERKLHLVPTPSAPPSPAPPPYQESRHLVVPSQFNLPRAYNGIILDRREQFSNQQIDTGVLSEQMFGMQMMWYVQQMGYALYQPPPPYCDDCIARRNDYVHDQKEISASEDPIDDKALLLPPAYSEERLDINQTFTTYL